MPSFANPITMHEDSILGLLPALDGLLAEGKAFSTDLGGGVYHAYVWQRLPTAESDWCYADRQEFYFIRSPPGLWIGALLVMGESAFDWTAGASDMHGVMLPHLRGQGTMSKALRERILPHRASIGRTSQRVTYRDERVWGLLKPLGFEEVGPHEAVVQLAPYAATTIHAKLTHLNWKCEVAARDRLRMARIYLTLVRDQMMHADTIGYEASIELEKVRDLVAECEALY